MTHEQNQSSPLPKSESVKVSGQMERKRTSTKAEADQWRDDLLRYRKEHFAVEVRPTRNPEFDEQITLAVTFNGNQWTALSLLPGEIQAIVTALTNIRKGR